MTKKIAFLITILIATTASAQRANSSPYSFFGIGENFNIRTVEQNNMGGIGASFSSPYRLNFTNPAASSQIRAATYSLGALNNNLTVKYTEGEQASSATSVSYIAFGFPLGKKAGFYLGIQPLTSVGYSLSNETLNDDEETIEVSLFSGNGGVNRIYGSFGYQITKEFSLGVEGGFAFGNIDNTILNQLLDVQFATKYNKSSTVRGGIFKLGAQYKKELKNKLFIDAGAVFALSNTMNLAGSEQLSSLTISSTGVEFIRDTTVDEEITGTFTSPLKSTFGIGVGKPSKWYLSMEFETQEALKSGGYLDASEAAYQYAPSNRFSLGGFYIPKTNSLNNYFERVTYSAGLRFEETGLLVNGTSENTNFDTIDDFGMSFGLCLPLGKQLSNINLGIEYGQRGTTNNNLIEENYFNFRVSLSLNDLNWFLQRKID